MFIVSLTLVKGTFESVDRVFIHVPPPTPCDDPVDEEPFEDLVHAALVDYALDAEPVDLPVEGLPRVEDVVVKGYGLHLLFKDEIDVFRHTLADGRGYLCLFESWSAVEHVSKGRIGGDDGVVGDSPATWNRGLVHVLIM
jgi:hypothetical protein